MKCQKCNHDNPDTNKFCSECGAKLEKESNTIECPNCHHHIPDDSRFCPDCGEKLSNQESNDFKDDVENDAIPSCPVCGSKDVYYDGTDCLPYSCKECGHLWNIKDSDDDNLDNGSSKASNIKEFTVNGVSFNMIKVDAGYFEFGRIDNTSNCFDVDEPKANVHLSGYWIGETVVTQELWTAVMGNNPSHYSCLNVGTIPVDSVSWNDCQVFIEKLNRLTGESFRLPTEAEWEYAARGGEDPEEYTAFSGSDEPESVGWFKENSNNLPHPVKTKMPNGLGIYDMSGNVNEWCNDYFDREYWRNLGDILKSNQYLCNPKGPEIGESHVVRIGCWCLSSYFTPITYRGAFVNEGGNFDTGFRLAISESEESM